MSFRTWVRHPPSPPAFAYLNYLFFKWIWIYVINKKLFFSEGLWEESWTKNKESWIQYPTLFSVIYLNDRNDKPPVIHVTECSFSLRSREYIPFVSLSVKSLHCLLVEALIYYFILLPPHSTTVNPVRVVFIRFCFEISTVFLDGYHVIKTLIRVSGFGLMFSFALLV